LEGVHRTSTGDGRASGESWKGYIGHLREWPNIEGLEEGVHRTSTRKAEHRGTAGRGIWNICGDDQTSRDSWKGCIGHLR
ncbi:hypothetical protein LSAT2_022252, partial [Lamellibrachia satsuma]